MDGAPEHVDEPMTTAILAIVTVCALIWMLRVETRLRELFDRLDRERGTPNRASTPLPDRVELF